MYNMSVPVCVLVDVGTSEYLTTIKVNAIDWARYWLNASYYNTTSVLEVQSPFDY